MSLRPSTALVFLSLFLLKSSSAAEPGCADRVLQGVCFQDTPDTIFFWNACGVHEIESKLDSPLVTDRPDFTEASSTVGRGVSQLEIGYTYAYDNTAGQSVRTQTFGEFLVRQGIFADWLELRIGLTPAEERTRTGGNSNSDSGLSDLYLGFKAALTPQEGLLPEMALIVQMNTPTGADAFTSNRVEPGANLIYGWEISDFLSTAGSTQGNLRHEDNGNEYWEIAQSWTVAYSLSEQVGAYTEWYGLFPSGADAERTEHYFNGGFTYLLNDHLQLDLRSGVGLNNAADDYFIGAGMSIRIP